MGGARKLNYQNCRFRQAYVFCAVAKEKLACRFHTVDPGAHNYLVKVNFEDFVFCKTPFHLKGPPELFNFPGESPFPPVRVQRSGNLLGYGRTAAQISSCELSHRRPGYTPD